VTEPIQAALERRRIEVDPDELARSVEDALAAAGGVPPYPKPAEMLPADQLDLLAKGGFELDGPDLGLSDPVLKGALEYAALRATALTTKEAAARLGVNDSRIRQRLADHALYGLKVDDEWRLPIFQFGDEGLVPNIDRVIARLDESLAAIAVFHWLTSPNPDLACSETSDAPVSPLSWLRLGLDPEPVAELAAQL
jgi:hypothetical protein